MGLSPDDFWSLTYREFQIKHRAFQRAEDRRRALLYDLADITVAGQKPEWHTSMQQNANALRRYPIKQWTVIPDGEDDIFPGRL